MSIFVLIVLCITAVCWFCAIFVSEDMGVAVVCFLMTLITVVGIVFQALSL